MTYNNRAHGVCDGPETHLRTVEFYGGDVDGEIVHRAAVLPRGTEPDALPAHCYTNDGSWPRCPCGAEFTGRGAPRPWD